MTERNEEQRTMARESDPSAPALARQVLGFLRVSEALKRELRHSWLSDARRESVAEHTWQMALMALLIHRHLERPIDLAHALQLILVHDLPEAEVGDIPFFEQSDRKAQKAQREQAAMERMAGMLDAETGAHLNALWREFEYGESPEAKFARALDHLEVQVQHNLAPIDTWEPVEYELVYTKMDGPCSHDAFLGALCAAVRAEAEEKMSAGGHDVQGLRARLSPAHTQPRPRHG
jgi:putative hydrolases of HD superfamily